MYYPDELVEEVRSQNDIVEVIGSYVRLTKKGSNYFGLCPFHNEKTGSFSVTPSKQMFYCFGCHEGGNVITFVQKYENYTFPEAVKTLAERAGINLPDNVSEEEKQQVDRRARILDINKEAGKYYYYQLRSPGGERAYAYLKNRGLDDDTIKRFGLGYARSTRDETYRYLRQKGYTDDLLNASGLFVYREKSGMTDKFWNRAIFPIMDANHRIVAFGGRVMGEGEPKYLNSPETEVFDKSRTLFGLNIAKTSKARNIIVCEGYMDAISLHQAGFDQVVASLGTAFTSGHANLLTKYAKESRRSSDDIVRYKEILMCYDSDQAGIDGTIRALNILKTAGFTAKVIDMKPYKDPDEFIKGLGSDEFSKRIDNAENGFMFILRNMEKDYDMADPSGKSKFLNDAARMILQFEDAVERESYIDRIAAHYIVSSDAVRELVKKYAAMGAGIKRSEAVKSSHLSKAQAAEGINKTQGMLLNWLSEVPGIYPIVREYIDPDDFTEGIYRTVADMLFKQLDEGVPEPAKIAAMFTEEEEQRVVAQMFFQNLDYIETVSEKEEALKDLIIKIREYSINSGGRGSQVSGTDFITAMIEQKKQLEQLHNINIKLTGVIN